MKIPLIFQPQLKRRIWGGTKLLSRGVTPVKNPIGESWELFDIDGSSSIIANGKEAGRSLHDLFRANPVGLCGENVKKLAVDHFPLFLKIVETCQDMSLHVHPSDDLAKQTIGPQAVGKHEAWYILDAKPGANIYYGLSKAISEDELRLTIAEGKLHHHLNTIPVRSGDFISVPAGLMHSAGKGITFLEMSQPCSHSYRVYDWNRKPARELHLDDALKAATRHKVSPASIRITKPKSGDKRQILLTHHNFIIEQLSLDYKTPVNFKTDGHTCSIVFILMGFALATSGGETVELSSWQSCLFPAEIKEFTLTGMRENCKALLFSL